MMKTKLQATCALVLLSGTALAQDFDGLGYRMDVQRPEREKTVDAVFEYDREQYRPEGIKLGGWNVLATTNADVLYDDNIYAQESNTQSDLILTVSPEVVLQSNWERHEVVVTANATVSEYMDNSDEDTLDYGMGVSTRVDVRRNSYATAGLRAQKVSEDRGDPNANSASAEPTEYSETIANLGYVHAQGKFSVGGDIQFNKKDYDDGLTTTGGRLENDNRDREQLNYTLRAGYEVRPGYEAFVRGTLTEVAYATEKARSSDGYEVVIGTELDLGGKVAGEVYAGYMSREYSDAAQFDEIAEPTFGADVLWNINGLTSLNGRVARTIQETTSGGDSGFISTAYEAVLQHELQRNVLLSGTVGYTAHTYEGFNSTREDDNLKVAAEAKYLLNKRYAIKAGYTYLERDSNIDTNDYERNMFLVGLSVSL